MNTDEFFPWLARQEAPHELVDGQPVVFAGMDYLLQKFIIAQRFS